MKNLSLRGRRLLVLSFLIVMSFPIRMPAQDVHAVKTLGTRLKIVTQPKAATVKIGANATFAVVVSGSKPVNFLWTHNGGAIPNNCSTSVATKSTTTTATLTLTNVTTTNAGSYRVTISNALGSLPSASVKLTVQPAPPKLAPNTYGGSLNTNQYVNGAQLVLAWMDVTVDAKGTVAVAVSDYSDPSVIYYSVSNLRPAFTPDGINLTIRMAGHGETFTANGTFAGGQFSGSGVVHHGAKSAAFTFDLE